MTDINTIIRDVKTILNSGSNVVDCYNGTRVGSLFFGPNDDMNFSKYMPKGQVTDQNINSERYTFGNKPRREKSPAIFVYFFTKKGDKDFTTGYKDKELVNDYLDRIEKAINDNIGSISGAHTPDYGETGRIEYDRENEIYWGVKPITFRFCIKSPNEVIDLGSLHSHNIHDGGKYINNGSVGS